MQDAPGPQGPAGPLSTPPRRRSRREWPLTILALLLVTVVAILQRPGEPDPAKVRAEMTGATVEPITINPLIGFSKAILWVNGKSTGEITPEQLLQYVEPQARTAADRFRVALLAGELMGSAAREQRFDELEKDLAAESPLRQDIKTAEAIKAHEADPESSAPAPQAVADFQTRHGWFARMILADQTPGGEAAFEREVSSDGQALLGVLFLAGAGILLAILTGVVLLIVALVKLLSGALHSGFVPTPQDMGGDRALWLETFCVFLAGFLALHGVHAALASWAGKDAEWTTAAALGLQWCLALTVFWPLLRGMSWERFRGELGWHRGRGFFREVGAGICGYLCGLPIYFGAAFAAIIVFTVVEALRHGGFGPGAPPQRDLPAPDNKVFDLLSHASGWELVLLGSLVVCWAPLVEESIFRGALFRHLRQRLPGLGGLLLTVVLVASAFALAHQYILLGVFLVGTLGSIFACMREWRGSLIAPMTAHCLHNSMVLTLLVTLLPLMRG